MAELNVCIFCGKEPEKPRQYGYQLTPRRNTCYCIDHSCDNGTFVSVHGFSREEVVEKWNKIMPAADVAPVRHGKWTPVKYNAHCSCGKSYGTYHFLCSACNHIAYSQPYGLNYCPNCGAKMDEVSG